jgi:hypothetical protein
MPHTPHLPDLFLSEVQNRLRSEIPDFCRETGISAPRTAAGTFLCIADPVSCRFCEIFLEKGFTNEPQKIII